MRLKEEKLMKKLIIILAIAVIALAITGCPTDSDSSSGDHDHKWEAWRVVDLNTPCIEERACLTCWASEFRHIDKDCEGTSGLTYSVSGDTVTGFSGLTPPYAVCIPDINPVDKATPITEINTDKFKNNPNLRYVRIGANVTKIGKNAFASTALRSVIIPASVTEIGNSAFYDCYNLSSVTFAKGANGAGSALETIDTSAFHGTALRSVIIPAGVTEIGVSAFRNAGLKSITIPAGITTIYDYTFENCKDLETVTFAKDSQLGFINANAFKGAGLTSITIPALVQTISVDAFANCKKLTTVTFAGSALTTINEGAFKGAGLKSVTIPASVNLIHNNAFDNCYSLSTVTFAPGSVLESIGASAFSNLALTSITIPASVYGIGELAFAYCGDLKTVTMLRETPPSLGAGAFITAHEDLKILVPADSVDDYQKATNWDYFADKIFAKP